MDELTLITDLIEVKKEYPFKKIGLRLFDGNCFDLSGIINLIRKLPSYFEFCNSKQYQDAKILKIGYQINFNKLEIIQNRRIDYNSFDLYGNPFDFSQGNKRKHEKNDLIIKIDLGNKTNIVKLKHYCFKIIGCTQIFVTKPSYKDNRLRTTKKAKLRNYKYFLFICRSKEYVNNLNSPPIWVKVYRAIRDFLSNFEMKEIIEYLSKNIEEQTMKFQLNQFTSFYELKEHLLGNSRIGVSLTKSVEKQWNIIIDDRKYYLCYYIWVSPFSKSIIQSGQSKAIEWDSTFNCCAPYCLCIPNAIQSNTSLPLGISIGYGETAEFYIDTYNEILKNTDCILSSVPILVDMGISLQSFAKTKNLKVYYCQRHIHEYFGSNSTIGPIIQIILNIDSAKLRDIVFQEIEFYLKTIASQNKSYQDLIKALLRMGLNFFENRISISDSSKFQSFINDDRKTDGVPTTTNHIESIHGHLNEDTSRRKCLFTVLRKLTNYCIKCVKNFNKNVKRNYFRRIKRVLDLYSMFPSDVIDQEIISYNTNLKGCLCGKSYNGSSLFKSSIPCIHQIRLGVTGSSINDFTPAFFECENIKSIEMVIIDGCSFNKPGRKSKRANRVHSYYQSSSSIMNFIEKTIDELTQYTGVQNRNEIAKIVIQSYTYQNDWNLSLSSRIRIMLRSLISINQDILHK